MVNPFLAGFNFLKWMEEDSSVDEWKRRNKSHFYHNSLKDTEQNEHIFIQTHWILLALFTEVRMAFTCKMTSDKISSRFLRAFLLCHNHHCTFQPDGTALNLIVYFTQTTPKMDIIAWNKIGVKLRDKCALSLILCPIAM